MKSPDKGDIFMHPTHGKVEYLEKSGRVFCIVKEVDRGPGWCHETNKYKGVRNKNGWFLGRNYCYGAEHKVRIDELKEYTI